MSGIFSNYNDSGYFSGTIGTTGPTSYSGLTSDIYSSVIQPGVLLINRTGTTIRGFNIIPSSSSDFANTNLRNVDAGYILYPGWAAQVFTSTNYTGTASNIFLNNTTNPVFYVTSTWTNTTVTNKVTNLGTSTTYTGNNTESIKIWFRGQEITISSF